MALKWIGIHVRDDTYKRIRLLAALKGTSYGQVMGDLVEEAFVKTGIRLEELEKDEEQPEVMITS